MPGTRLTFNELTFKHPEDQYTFHFTNEVVIPVHTDPSNAGAKKNSDVGFKSDFACHSGGC